MTSSQQIAAVVGVIAVIAIGGTFAYQASVSKPVEDRNDTDLITAEQTYQEARDLDERDALTAEVHANLTARYAASIGAVMRRLAELEAGGNTQASAELRAALREQIRLSRALFPNVTENGVSSSSAATESSTMSEGAGQSSSIFIQPSSSVTSA